MSLEIAKTIVQQLGGNKFMVMTGVKQFIGSEDGVSFKLPRSYNKINTVKITLTPLDLYDVEFLRVSIKERRTVAVRESVYADMLQQVFTAATGLDTHL
jgi:hypothetical protein